MQERNPHEVDPVMYADPDEYCDDQIVLRQHYCPACGSLWATEVSRAKDAPIDDVRIIDAGAGSSEAAA